MAQPILTASWAATFASRTTATRTRRRSRSNTSIDFRMKTNKSLVIVVIAFSMFVSNAFALVKSPYPRLASPPDNDVVIAHGGGTVGTTTIPTARNKNFNLRHRHKTLSRNKHYQT